MQVKLNEQYQFETDGCIYLIKCGNILTNPESIAIGTSTNPEKEENIITFTTDLEEAKRIAASILSDGLEKVKKDNPTSLVSTSCSADSLNVDVTTTYKGWLGTYVNHEFSISISKVNRVSFISAKVDEPVQENVSNEVTENETPMTVTTLTSSEASNIIKETLAEKEVGNSNLCESAEVPMKFDHYSYKKKKRRGRN